MLRRIKWGRSAQARLAVMFDDDAMTIATLVGFRGQYHLAKSLSVPLSAGVVERGRIVDQKAAADVLRETLDGLGITQTQAVSAVALDVLMTRTLTLAGVFSDDEIEAQIYLEAERYIAQPIDEVYFDFQVIARDDADVRVQLVAAYAAAVDDCVQTLALAGLDGEIITTPVCAFEALSLQDAALVVLGARPQLHIFGDGRIIHSQELIDMPPTDAKPLDLQADLSEVASDAALVNDSVFDENLSKLSPNFHSNDDNDIDLQMLLAQFDAQFDAENDQAARSNLPNVPNGAADFTDNFVNDTASDLPKDLADLSSDLPSDLVDLPNDLPHQNQGDYTIEFGAAVDDFVFANDGDECLPSASVDKAVPNLSAAAIAQALSLYQLSHEGAPIQTLYVLGGSDEWVQTLADQTHIAAQALSAQDVVANAEPSDDAAMAAILLAMAADRSPINLLPWRAWQRAALASAFKKQAMATATVCLGLIALAYAAIFIKHQQQMAINDEISIRTENLNSEIGKLAADQKSLQEQQEKVAAISAFDEQNQALIMLWQQLATLSDGVYYTNVRKSNDEIVIDGQAANAQAVSAFAHQLELNGFGEVMITAMQKQAVAQQFSLQAKILPVEINSDAQAVLADEGSESENE